MSLLLFTARSYQLSARKQELNYKLYQLRQDLMDLQRFAASISDGISMSDLAQSPAAYFGTMVNFMQNSFAQASMGANQKFNMMVGMGALQNVDPSMQAQYQMMLKNQLYEQEREKIAKAQTKQLDLKEREINAQIKKYEDQLAMIEAEEKSVNDAKDKAIQNSAPRYVA